MKSKSALLLIFTLALVGCGQKQDTTKLYYRLDALKHSQDTTQEQKKIVIFRPAAHGILGNRPMVAVASDGGLVQMNRHFWLESPKILLHQELMSWAKEHWQEVLSGRPAEKDYITLDSIITAFEKDGDVAKVGIQFKLSDAKGQQIFNQQFQHQQKMTGVGYAEFVTAISQSIASIIEQLTTRMKSP